MLFLVAWISSTSYAFAKPICDREPGDTLRYEFQTGRPYCWPEGATFIADAYLPTGDDGQADPNAPPTIGDAIEKGPELLYTIITNIVYVFTVGLGSLVAHLASSIFSIAVYISLNSTAYAMQFITDAWESVRDIANMGFIFVLVYVAIKVMLSADTAGTMRTLSRVILFALLINFSFFFARVVIDAGNILAVNFYNQIEAPALNANVGGSIAQSAGLPLIAQSVTSGKDLTHAITGAVGVQDLLGTKAFDKFKEQNSTFTQIIGLSFIYIIVGIVFGLLAALFFTVGVKFIMRVVILWLAIIASPLALLMAAMGSAVPQAQNWFKQWRSALVFYSIYPAIFLFLFLIIIKFTTGLTGCPPGVVTGKDCSILAAALSEINGTTATGMSYITGLGASVGIRLGFIIVLLMLAMQVSQKISSMGGALAGKITSRPDKWAEGIAGRLRGISTIAPRAIKTAGGTVLTRPINLVGVELDKRIKNSRWANSPGIPGSVGGGIRSKIAQPLTKTSILGATTLSDAQKQWAATDKERSDNLNAIKNRASIATIVDQLENKGATATTLSSNPAFKEALSAVQNMSETRIKELSAAQVQTLSKVFTENQMKVVDKLDKLSEQDKENAQKNFNIHSPNSPIYKAQKQLEELRKINKTLTGRHNIVKIDQHLDVAKAGTPLTSAALGEIRSEIKTKTAQIRSDIKKAPAGTDTFDLQQALDTLQEATKKMDKYDENMGKAPAGSQAKVPA